MDKTKLGAASELTACAWLLTQGYEVFRNVAPTGPFDLVAVKDGEAIYVDVKTVKETKGSVTRKFNTSASKHQGLNRKILFVKGNQVSWSGNSITDDVTHNMIESYLRKVQSEDRLGRALAQSV